METVLVRTLSMLRSGFLSCLWLVNNPTNVVKWTNKSKLQIEMFDSGTLVEIQFFVTFHQEQILLIHGLLLTRTWMLITLVTSLWKPGIPRPIQDCQELRQVFWDGSKSHARRHVSREVICLRVSYRESYPAHFFRPKTLRWLKIRSIQYLKFNFFF